MSKFQNKETNQIINSNEAKSLLKEGFRKRTIAMTVAEYFNNVFLKSWIQLPEESE